MANKQLFGTIGLTLFVFLLLLMVVSGFGGITWATIPGLPSITIESLNLLWTDLFPVVLIQGLVLFAALLGVNLQFTPVKKH